MTIIIQPTTLRRIARQLLAVITLVLLPLAAQAMPEATLYMVHNDHLGTPKAMTNMDADVVWRAEADPFGQTQVNEDVDGDGNTVTMNVRFPGQYFDAESGLHYNYFRYYDPSTGRYVTSDPIGLAAGVNTYGYVGGNPNAYSDPSGLSPHTWSFRGGMAVGGAIDAAVARLLGPSLAAIIGPAVYDLLNPGAQDVPSIYPPDPLDNIYYDEPAEGESCPEGDSDGERHSPDRQALNDLINSETSGGRKPLSNPDADTILDWAGELGVDGARDDRGKDHWVGGEHIHVPGSGIPHIPTEN